MLLPIVVRAPRNIPFEVMQMKSHFLFGKYLLRKIPALASFAIFFACALIGTRAWAADPLLLRNPSLSQTKIAFLYADDIWTVPRAGGVAERLTSQSDVVEGPYYSPDGSEIAYSRLEHGLTNVYIIGSEGGVPRRLTWDNSGHFGSGNYALGWTPDGKEVLFDSMRSSWSDFFELFETAADGHGTPSALPLPSAAGGSISPDGQTIAYVPILQWEAAWKHYRGGQTTPIWLVNLKTLDLVKIPRDNSNDSSPVWEGSTVYFLSDRNGPVSLFSYDTDAKKLSQVVENHQLRSEDRRAGPGALVYEQFGSLHLYDLATHQQHAVPITIEGDLPGLAPHLANIRPEELQNLDISPTGVRLVAEAHGDIFTCARRQGRHAQPDQDSGRSRTRPRLVARRQIHRLLQRRLRRIPALHPRPGRHEAAHGHRSRARIPRSSTGPTGRPTPSTSRTLTSTCASGMCAVIRRQARAHRHRPSTAASANNIELCWSPDSKWIAYKRDLENQYERDLPLLARHAQIHADHRWHEQRRSPGLRPQRQVPLLHRLHQ